MPGDICGPSYGALLPMRISRVSTQKVGRVTVCVVSRPNNQKVEEIIDVGDHIRPTTTVAKYMTDDPSIKDMPPPTCVKMSKTQLECPHPTTLGSAGIPVSVGSHNTDSNPMGFARYSQTAPACIPNMASQKTATYGSSGAINLYQIYTRENPPPGR